MPIDETQTSEIQSPQKRESNGFLIQPNEVAVDVDKKNLQSIPENDENLSEIFEESTI